MTSSGRIAFAAALAGLLLRPCAALADSSINKATETLDGVVDTAQQIFDRVDVIKGAPGAEGASDRLFFRGFCTDFLRFPTADAVRGEIAARKREIDQQQSDLDKAKADERQADDDQNRLFNELNGATTLGPTARAQLASDYKKAEARYHDANYRIDSATLSLHTYRADQPLFDRCAQMRLAQLANALKPKPPAPPAPTPAKPSGLALGKFTEDASACPDGGLASGTFSLKRVSPSSVLATMTITSPTPQKPICLPMSIDASGKVTSFLSMWGGQVDPITLVGSGTIGSGCVNSETGAIHGTWSTKP